MRGLAIVIAYVVVEFALAIWIASLVGWLLVIGLTIAGFALGLLIMSNAGTQAVTAFSQASQSGQQPKGAIGDSAVTFAAGALIMVPGFLTDFIGLLLLIPPIRRATKSLGILSFARWARRQNMTVVTTTVQGETVTRVVPGDVVVGDVIRRDDVSENESSGDTGSSNGPSSTGTTKSNNPAPREIGNDNQP